MEPNLLVLPKGFTFSMKYFSLVTRTRLGFCTCSNIQVGYYLSSGGLTYGNLECFKRCQNRLGMVGKGLRNGYNVNVFTIPIGD